jgi:hypothetical protein
VLAGWGTGQNDEERAAAYLWQNQRKAELRVRGISVLILEHLFCPVHPGTVKQCYDVINFKFHDNYIQHPSYANYNHSSQLHCMYNTVVTSVL